MTTILTHDIRKYVNELIEKEFGTAPNNLDPATENTETTSARKSKKENKPSMCRKPED